MQLKRALHSHLRRAYPVLLSDNLLQRTEDGLWYLYEVRIGVFVLGALQNGARHVRCGVMIYNFDETWVS